MFAAALHGSVRAQSEVLFSTETRGPLVAPADRINANPALLQSDLPPVHPWSIDFLIGLPTGVRVKRFVDGSRDSGFIVEAFAGIGLFYLPMAGVGVRYACLPWTGDYNVFSISPGVDVYGLFAVASSNSSSGYLSSNNNIHGASLIAMDVDFCWRHVYDERLSGELGLKVGLFSFFAFPFPLPVLSLFAGFRF